MGRDVKVCILRRESIEKLRISVNVVGHWLTVTGGLSVVAGLKKVSDVPPSPLRLRRTSGVQVLELIDLKPDT